TFNNRNSFIATSNPYEYNSNFIYQSSLSGTQSTPPTSRLINDQSYTYDTFLQNERIHPQRILIPGENYFLLNADQFRSASLNELRYLKSIQPSIVTNKAYNPNANIQWYAKNGFIVKSPADSFDVNTSIESSKIFNSRNLLPPQYGSSYHQKIYMNSSRARSPPPQHLQTYHQKNNPIDDRQSLADCRLNEYVSSFSPSNTTLGSPSVGRYTTGQTTQSKAAPSSSEYQHFTEITNQLGHRMKDDNASTLSKSPTITNNKKNHFKRLNVERECGKAWRSITLLSSPSLIDVFHWLSHGQMNNNFLSSNGLIKSNSIHYKSQKFGSMNASLYSRSKSLERSYNDFDSVKCSSTVKSRRKTHETIPSCINNVSNGNNNNDVLSEPICNSSSSSTALLSNSIYNNKSQQIYQECLLKSNKNGLFNKKISIPNNTVLNNKNNPVRTPNSSDNYENRSSVSPIHHAVKTITTPHLDKVNKSPLSHNGLNSSVEQRQTFQFAYTKRNFLSWDKNMISAWLYKIGLGYTVTHTRKWLTSGQDLVNESKKSLAQLMGIRNPLHLKKLLIHIRLCMKDNYPANNNTTTNINNYDGYLYRNVEPPENFDMSGWLNDLGLSQYIPQFDKCIIDPYVLDQLTMEDLSILKIFNELHMLSLRWGLQMLRHINFDRNRLCRDHLEQCSANIPLKRNILYSPIPSENENLSHTSLLNTTLERDSVNIRTNSNSLTYSPIQICYWTQTRVVNWLQSIELPEYASELCGSGVHGALIILEDRFTPDLLADILRIPPVKSLVRRHLTQKFIELVGLEIWQRKQHSEVSNNLLTLHSKIKLTKKKSIFHSTRGSKSNLHHHDDDNDISNELVCPIEINANHISVFAEEVSTPIHECIHETGNIPTMLLDPTTTNVQKLELQETDL
ncbi:Liprin-beta-1 isoform 1, partial [Schistosoma japonicum]